MRIININSQPHYRKLLKNIQGEMAAGIRRIERLLERQKILTYLSIGRHINAYLVQNELERGDIGVFYEKLSSDSKINSRTLQQCEQFYRYFPNLKITEGLTWSHYRCLLVLPTEKERRMWIARLEKEKIPANVLQLKLLPAGQGPVNAGATELLAPARGRLYTYRIRRAEGLEGVEVPWFVDCGFANRIEAPAANAILDNKNIYTSEKTEAGYRLKVTDRKVEELYTFKAQMRRVIDGDTLLTEVDQGFGVWTEQRLRLRGIDTPEMSTLLGKKAKMWLENELKDLPFVVVKTYKSDQHDRYLVDVFYERGQSDAHRVAAEGIYLNDRLVREGLAQIWR